jgi:hypothetical protein
LIAWWLRRRGGRHLDEQVVFDCSSEERSLVCGPDLEKTGRVLAWIGATIKAEEIEVGMPLQVVPRIFEESEEIKVYYTSEQPGTTWSKGDSAR